MALVKPAAALELWRKDELSAAAQNRGSSRASPLDYTVSIQGDGLTVESTARLKQVSSLEKLKDEGAADVAQLIARARADQKLLKAVLYEGGHYAADVSILRNGLDVETGQALEREGAADARNDLVIVATPGPVFRLGEVTLTTTRPTLVGAPMTPEAYGLDLHAVARSMLIVNAIDRIVEEWRIAGYPFARISHRSVRADHATRTVSVHIEIDPGRSATYGWLNVAGTEQISPTMVARYSGLGPGRRYSSNDLEKAGERLRKLEAIESVRIVPGDDLDADGGIPITFHVTERKRRFIGATASASTIDGGEAQVYWGHRNLFGRAERLKVEGTVSQIGSEHLEDLQYGAKARLTMPAIFDIDTDLYTEFRGAKERPATYESRSLVLEAGLFHRFSETRTGSIAIVGSFLEEQDAFGTASHRLISAPAEVVLDARDDKLDPSEGWRLMLGAEPAYDFAGGKGFAVGRTAISTYVAVGEQRSVILAGRIGAQSIVGPDIEDIPANMRLYGGGSGSVRGYAYRSLGPRLGNKVIGGRGLFEGSLELRWRATETIGLVAFFDAASVARESLPNFSDAYAGAGVGLRYYTSLGPIRLDIALPLESDVDLSDLAFYVGIGQAF